MWSWIAAAPVIYILWVIEKAQNAAVYRWSQQMQMLGAIHEELESIKDASATAAYKAEMIEARKRKARSQERLTG